MSATVQITVEGNEVEYECDQILTIGRSKANDITLSDPKVSRNHAIVRRLGDGNYYVMDMGSANGTVVNNKRVLVPCALSNFDLIKIGNHQLTFHQEEVAEAEADDEDEFTHPTMFTVGGAIHHVTTLVTDIRGYTPMSEKIGADFLAQILSRWCRVASEIVGNNGGVVDKFIGDAIMVRWADDGQIDVSPVVAALYTAHQLNIEAGVIDTEFPDLPNEFKIGVGINTGQAVLGNVGGSNKDYTALGDSVNLAFRFEKASKELGKDVVLGPKSYEQLPNDICESHIVPVQVKGKEKPINVCAFSYAELAEILEKGL